MPREIRPRRALLNATLALTILGVAGFGAARIAARHWRWQATFTTQVAFPQVGGLEVGGKVRVQGIDAGVVAAIVPPQAPGGPVVVVLQIDATLRNLVRSDASARITAAGIVGGKVIEIVPGLATAAPLSEAGSLKAEPAFELTDLLRDASAALARIDAAATTAEHGLAEINALVADVRQGRGSLGKFVRDDEAYQRLISMSSRGEKAMVDLDENLAALKQTWPVSRYFNGRGFEDRERVLFRPGADRETRTLRGDDLFEPTRAVLTGLGRRQLDEFARWFLNLNRPKTTDIVIAAFTDDARGDEELAQALTQEQAESVRKYLISRHGIDAVGWFSSRKVAAVGFGTQTPRAEAEMAANPPLKRVEIILFTPRT